MKILNHLPYSAEPTTVAVPGDTLRVKPHQIVVQVSISLRTLLEWDPRTPVVPAVLDTGNNHHFAIRRSHLLQWTGLHPEALDITGHIRERQQRLPLHAAGLWLHPNRRGSRERSGAAPHLLEVREGIAVYPDETGPRLPVLGLRALTRNRLHLFLDGGRQSATLRTPDWRTWLLRWVT